MGNKGFQGMVGVQKGCKRVTGNGNSLMPFYHAFAFRLLHLLAHAARVATFVVI